MLVPLLLLLVFVTASAFIGRKVASWIWPPTAFDVAAFLAAKETQDLPPRNVVVILNPVAGGQGKASAIWSKAKAVLDAFGPHIDVTLVRTTAAGHARRWAAQELTLEVDTVLCIGGDGTLFEIVNGIFSRPDALAIVSKVALAVVPAGSGNGLGTSLGIPPQEVEKAVAIAMRGRRKKLNIMKVSQGPTEIFCFLFMAYGLIADCDFESEAYRLLGPLRFHIAAAIRILFKRRYRVKIRYTPVVEFENLDDLGTHCQSAQLVERELEVTGIIVSNCPWMTCDFQCAPKSAMGDGFLDVTFGLSTMTQSQMIQMLINSETGGYINFPSVRYFKTKQIRVEAIGGGLPNFFLDDNCERAARFGRRVIYGQRTSRLMRS